MNVQLSPYSHLVIFADVFKDYESGVDELMAARPTTRDKINCFGVKEIPRFQALFGDASYTYSGIELAPIAEIPSLVQKCLDFGKSRYPEFHWGGALVNWYMDGSDYVSMHSDDERDLEAGAPILSFSFGAERLFRIEPLKSLTGGFLSTVTLTTRNNSCIVMGGNMQREFAHGIVATKKPTGPRINVTVRSFKASSKKHKA